MPETSQEQALLAGSRLLAAIGGEPIVTQAGPLPVTVSIGVAGDRDGTLHLNLEMLLKRADEALYDAKRAGRDRVAYYAEPEPGADPAQR
jgi:diguanylate cyclase (GGDEF)-like protein